MSDALEQISEEIPAELQQYVEKVDEVKEPEKQQEASNESVEVKADPLAEKAKASGWTDKDAWVEAGKDPDQWVDAGEFVRRAPLFDELKILKRELKDSRKKLDATAQFAARAEEVGRNKALRELEDKRMQAVEIGDVDAFKAVDDELKELNKQAPAEPQEQEIPDSVKAFSDRNQHWFEKDQEMTEFAVERTRFHRQKGLDLEAALEKSEAEVKRMYADKFVNPNKEKPAAVAPNNTERRPQSFTWNNLTSEQKNVFHAMRGVMTKDEYIDQLRKQGELK